MRIRIRFRIQLITLIRIRIQIFCLMRIQDTKMLQIHADQDPQHCPGGSKTCGSCASGSPTLIYSMMCLAAFSQVQVQVSTPVTRLTFRKCTVRSCMRPPRTKSLHNVHKHKDCLFMRKDQLCVLAHEHVSAQGLTFCACATIFLAQIDKSAAMRA